MIREPGNFTLLRAMYSQPPTATLGFCSFFRLHCFRGTAPNLYRLLHDPEEDLPRRRCHGHDPV